METTHGNINILNTGHNGVAESGCTSGLYRKLLCWPHSPEHVQCGLGLNLPVPCVP